MTFTLSPDTEQELTSLKRYYRVRGCQVHDHGSSLSVMIYSPCPQMPVTHRPAPGIAPLEDLWQGQGCHNYSTRPKLCRVYDGRLDPFMAERCKLPTEGP